METFSKDGKIIGKNSENKEDKIASNAVQRAVTIILTILSFILDYSGDV